MATVVIGRFFFGPDQLERSVWVVVDPRDFVTGQRVLTPLRVQLKDVIAEPITARSRVYCFTDLRLPAANYTVQVEPLLEGRDYYFPAQKAFALELIPVPGAPLNRNRVELTLLPRPAYPFTGQATLARSRLVKASDGSGIAGAQIFLIFGAADQGLRGQTDERGEFAVFFPPTHPEDDDTATLKLLKFRLRFELAGHAPHLTGEETVKEGTTIALKQIAFPGT
jgi:hypothetical protein